MKNLILFMVVLLSTAFIACEKEVGQISDVDQKELNPENYSVSDRSLNESSEIMGIEIPPNSNVYYVDSQMIIELPAGYEYVGTTTNGQVIGTGVVGVRCECTDGYGCTPNKTTDKNGRVEYTCIMQTNCSACTKEETRNINGDREKIEVVGLVNYNVGIGFLTDIDFDAPSSPLFDVSQYFTHVDDVRSQAFEQLFELEKFSYWANEREDFYTPSTVHSENEKVWFNIFGNLVVTTVKKGFEIQVGDVTYRPLAVGENPGAVDDGKVTCYCHSGTGCEYFKRKVPFGSTYEFCEAKNCTDCELRD